MVRTLHERELVRWAIFMAVGFMSVGVAISLACYTAIVLGALGAFILSGHAWFHATAHAGYVFAAGALCAFVIWGIIEWSLLQRMLRWTRKEESR